MAVFSRVVVVARGVLIEFNRPYVGTTCTFNASVNRMMRVIGRVTNACEVILLDERSLLLVGQEANKRVNGLRALKQTLQSSAFCPTISLAHCTVWLGGVPVASLEGQNVARKAVVVDSTFLSSQSFTAQDVARIERAMMGREITLSADRRYLTVRFWLRGSERTDESLARYLPRLGKAIEHLLGRQPRGG